MALKIVWSKRAILRFNQIVTYLGNEWGEKAVKEFIRSVFDFLEILSEYPELGSLENKERNIRGFTVVKQVNLYYRIDKDKITLLIFFDNRQHPRKKRI